MKTLIEVNPLLHHERTGIPNYVHWVTERLLAQAPEEDWTLWAPDLDRDPFPEYPRKRFRGRGLFPRAVLERLWEDSAVGAVPPDVQVYHLPFPAFPAPRRSRDTRLVVTVFDLAFARYPETLLDREYLRYLTRCFPAQVEQADRILAISECTKRDLVEILDVPPERIDVIYLGTDLRAPGPEVPASLGRLELPPRFLLTVGTREPRKNLPSVLRAVHRLLPKLRERDVYLCLAGGSRWKYQEADRLVEELGLEDRVVSLGFAPRECLPHLYARSLAFLYPSFYEGFGLPVLEAMACGAPVVTSTSSSLPEVAGDAALMVDPHSVDELAHAIERLLDDEALRADLVRRGRERASLFSWDQTALETLAVFRKLAG
jgi:glycosyltransferase involved in cell wall biosynthesis